MFHPSSFSTQDCTVLPSASTTIWNSTPRDAGRIAGSTNLHPSMSSITDNASWACTMPPPSIHSQQWGPFHPK
ncbi:hypothetical protein Cob_v010939 [Colletotrichum orbiculare MAFF 240422]|uniref:Uncharacterized protein n=1 Tax=Colletotrichum orbiculare (strain 104-T / ATCC 96160 / CBS 514.97 / LARS 414 / MAFF 240422) TaxID=1213857 RepID=A0A484FE95_COLOR|nr:hypothetical protein Cob_v010939 [Colletotrichum orbiculare MAFF 240422]